MTDQDRRQAFLVLGMHRSGTSALSGALSLAGVERPRTMMPPTTENPQGYWESRVIAKANNHFLKTANTRWDHSAKISEEWFQSKERGQDRQRIVDIIRTEYPAHGDILIKDPRICRLLPLWIAAIRQAGFAPRCILILRDSRQVAASLAARAAVPEFSPAAIQSRNQATLLWLRYVLDMERYSRREERINLCFSELVLDWRSCLEPVFARGWLKKPSQDTAERISNFINPRLRHQTDLEPDDEGLDELDLLSERLICLLRRPDKSSQVQLDSLHDRLGQMQQLYNCNEDYSFNSTDEDRLTRAILTELSIESSFVTHAQDTPKKAIFISASPKSIGHIYRVKNLSTALSMAGWSTLVKTIGDPSIERELPGFNIAIVFRAKLDRDFSFIHNLCSIHKIPLVFNIDDLLFDPKTTESGCIAYLDKVTEDERLRWFKESFLYRDALNSCNAAVLSTEPLRSAANEVIDFTETIPNILSPELERAAELATTRSRLSEKDGIIRLVFASGTPTHHRDFMIAAEGIARVLKQHNYIHLVIIGNLEISEFPILNEVSQQVEKRPLVPFSQLTEEIAKYDINLCPLEPENQFCECKSAVRCLVASTVGVPTVASRTRPLSEMIIDGVTGVIVKTETPESWETELIRMVTDSKKRQQYSNLARADVLARYSIQSWHKRISKWMNSAITNYCASIN